MATMEAQPLGTVSSLQNQNLLIDTLTQARRRHYTGLLLAGVGMASAVIAALFCVLLLAGIQVLSLPAIAALVAVGIGLVIWRLRSQRIDLYQTAQAMDRSFGLPDTLSTAWHFGQQASFSDVRQAQLEPLITRQQDEALRALSAHQTGEAFPLKFSRVHLAALVVCTIAVGLFAYRYLQSESLDLQNQLASLHVPFINNEGEAPAMISDDERYQPLPEAKRSPLEEYQPPYDPSRERLDGTYNDMPPVTGINVSGEEAAEGSEAASNGNESANDMRNQLNADPRRQQDGNKPDGGKREGGNQKQKEGNSLFDKFQEAVGNMMDKFSNQNKEAMEQRGEQQGKQDAKNAGDKAGDGSDDSSDREGNQRNENANANENSKQGAGGQQAQDMGKQDNASANESASDAPSSVGADDGSKKMAENRQMEAMGKISEILGQRSEQVKGDMKIEVDAQKEQTLTTSLRNIRGEHKDGGGEVTRDAVPLRLQNYVKEYLKATRQADAAATASKPAPAATPTAERSAEPITTP